MSTKLNLNWFRQRPWISTTLTKNKLSFKWNNPVCYVCPYAWRQLCYCPHSSVDSSAPTVWDHEFESLALHIRFKKYNTEKKKRIIFRKSLTENYFSVKKRIRFQVRKILNLTIVLSCEFIQYLPKECLLEHSSLIFWKTTQPCDSEYELW